MSTTHPGIRLRDPIGLRKGRSLDDLVHEEISAKSYKHDLRQAQLELLTWQRRLTETKNNVVVVMEGPDAAGKGGAIKRLLERLDPRLVRVHSTVKPSTEEYGRHYLWRFWSRLPPYGWMAVFDRSWYGRVLVERVEGFCETAEWKRAYREINEFERQLLDDGTILVKFYLFITKAEQLTRFKSREADPYKHWKISDEDWRNRRHWKENMEAAEEMLVKTSTERAPWHVIGANFKWHTRLRVVNAVLDTINRATLRDSAL
jgi:polyphosphate kinase 2 (PPK2 family)